MSLLGVSGLIDETRFFHRDEMEVEERGRGSGLIEQPHTYILKRIPGPFVFPSPTPIERLDTGLLTSWSRTPLCDIRRLIAVYPMGKQKLYSGLIDQATACRLE